MKKILIVLLVSLLALSCEKSNNDPSTSNTDTKLMEVTFHGDIFAHHRTVKVNGVEIDNHTTNVKTGDVIYMHAWNSGCSYTPGSSNPNCSKAEVKLSLDGVHRTKESCNCKELEHEFVID